MKPLIDPDTAPRPAFGLAEELAPASHDWHAHQRHQLLYCAAGLLRLVSEDTHWLLPPQRLAYIAAGVRHRIVVPGRASLRTVYLDPSWMSLSGPCRVFVAPPLARELLCFAVRYGPEHAPDPTAAHLFRALAGLCAEWAADPLPLSLPAPKTPAVEQAMRYALEHLAHDPSLADAARTAGVSARTLSRRFSEEAKLSWRAFVHQARMLRALELLARPRATVGGVAAAVGFDSVSAFSRAFSAFAGEGPKELQRRLRG